MSRRRSTYRRHDATLAEQLAFILGGTLTAAAIATAQLMTITGGRP